MFVVVTKLLAVFIPANYTPCTKMLPFIYFFITIGRMQISRKNVIAIHAPSISPQVHLSLSTCFDPLLPEFFFRRFSGHSLR